MVPSAHSRSDCNVALESTCIFVVKETHFCCCALALRMPLGTWSTHIRTSALDATRRFEITFPDNSAVVWKLLIVSWRIRRRPCGDPELKTSARSVAGQRQHIDVHADAWTRDSPRIAYFIRRDIDVWARNHCAR